MNLIGTTVEIQNTDSPYWFVTMREAVTTTQGETLSIRVIVRRGEQPLGDVQRLAIQRAIELLQSQLPTNP